jgi:hypothetical protein
VLFDWLGSDATPPLGVMALWPVTSEFYFAHAYVFEAISRRTHLPNFWPHNLWAVAKEVLMLAPVAAGAWAWRRGSCHFDGERHAVATARGTAWRPRASRHAP